ncbi:anhydro-N-acetylmuramic acid kinase [Rhodoferax sp.]|uniref:anhydro-N-acetylmuramic acid kinase n=1 Tax=Rhodoferax sp. TaxID=50421 RepID=UPI002778F5C4|nr:anhydro-N-acetylmuramic acid kinase [Rhodoferax sp.]
MSERYIGLMSGTSLDGVDGVLVDFSGLRPHVLGHVWCEFSPPLREEMLALNRSGADELHRGALAANALVRVYAGIVEDLLRSAGLDAASVRAIGAHGQTVRHRPGEFDGTGYTLQINNPALLAELTGIDVVADFRSRDVAAGGQGAPLVPAFHQAVFGAAGERAAVLNLGGIANLTVLSADPGAPVLGFDCGPGNVLLDSWCLRHLGQPYDADGAWAASGQAQPSLLEQLLSEPYFAKAPPKSTGRDLFNLDWLLGHLTTRSTFTPVDVQATLTELTARTCATDLQTRGPGSTVLLVCGGGALNGQLMRRLQAHLPSCRVESSAKHGLPPLQVEAVAFAWLARKTARRETGSLQSVTGALGARVLGCFYPA